MRPMQHATFLIPHIFTVKFHRIACTKVINARCHVDVMSNEQSLPRRQFEDEPLVTAPNIVIR